MHIVSKRALREFWNEHIESEDALRRWFGIANKARWHNLAETKADYSSAESVGTCTVFNIRGNDYRLIVYINYRIQRVYILHILTHKQ